MLSFGGENMSKEDLCLSDIIEDIEYDVLGDVEECDIRGW